MIGKGHARVHHQPKQTLFLAQSPVMPLERCVRLCQAMPAPPSDALLKHQVHMCSQLPAGGAV